MRRFWRRRRGEANDGEPRDEAPRDEAPRDEAPRDKAPRERAPGDKAPRERAPRDRAPRAARGVYGGVGFLATVIDVVVGIVTVIIALGIALFVLGANQDNAIVEAIHDVAEFLVGPFKDIFELDDEKQHVAINWGIAIVVYFVVGRVITGLMRRGAG